MTLLPVNHLKAQVSQVNLLKIGHKYVKPQIKLSIFMRKVSKYSVVCEGTMTQEMKEDSRLNRKNNNVEKSPYQAMIVNYFEKISVTSIHQKWNKDQYI